uniref:Tc1-like transposase DDE domain-containing protein n=1 Tax=Caenorhabditis japonica TaxID=281687 RepID=A0A8R1HU75_CAEJA
MGTCKSRSDIRFPARQWPKHTSGHIKNWFQRRRVDLLDWPSQARDLNPIEHLWEELERRIQGVRASNVNQKFDLLEAAWKDIPMSVIHKLLDSMPRRCQAVIVVEVEDSPSSTLKAAIKAERTRQSRRQVNFVTGSYSCCRIRQDGQEDIRHRCC